MNPPPPQQPPSATRKQNLILGPRPTPLRLSKDSVKIKKPPRAPPPPPPHTAASQPPPQQPQQPVIIYSVSPKPIIVEASNFLTLVQQLTGRTTSTSPPVSTSGEAPPSPAARLAAYERTSPKEGEWRRTEERERQAGGILSPAPGNLPGISAEMFTTTTAAMTGTVAGEGSSFMGMSELMSPFMNNYNMAFLQSPSSLLFNNVSSFVSPSPSNNDFFNIFDL